MKKNDIQEDFIHEKHTGKISLTITLLWVMVIFSFSLQPADTSSQLSLGLGHWLIDLLPSAISDKLLSMPQAQLEFLHTLLRKVGHFPEYFILGMLSMFTVLQSKFCHKMNNPGGNPSPVRHMEITNPFCWKSRFR